MIKDTHWSVVYGGPAFGLSYVGLGESSGMLQSECPGNSMRLSEPDMTQNGKQLTRRTSLSIQAAGMPEVL